MEDLFQTVFAGNITNSAEDISIEICRTVSFSQGYNFKMHHHKRIELNYILNGSCIMMLENELVRLNKNNSILIFPGSKHDFYVNSKCGVKLVQLEFQISKDILMLFKDAAASDISFVNTLENKSGQYYKIPNNPDIRNCMERIILENKLKHNNYKALTKLYFLELIILLSRHISNNQKFTGHIENACIKKAMKLIHSNYCYSLSTSQIAGACSVTPRYLRKLFNTWVESSPKEYCTNLRMKKAVELLANQNISIKEIAFNVGYSTPQYFSRAFKEKYGFSPQTYRKILSDPGI
jgi:AraC-like DNA-binding protein/mannose-6-phosphate isomerase-like protein (cupin superfamily)